MRFFFFRRIISFIFAYEKYQIIAKHESRCKRYQYDTWNTFYQCNTFTIITQIDGIVFQSTH